MSDTPVSAAEALYGKSEPAASPSAPAESAATATATALYGAKPAYIDKSVSDAKIAERNADPARGMYSAQTSFQSAVPDDASDVFTDVPAAREVMADYGLAPTEAGELLSMMRQLPTLDEDARARWHIESVALNVPKADLDRAREYVAQDPRVFDLLDRSGLGNHPRVVQHIVQAAKAAAILKGSR